MTSEHRPFLFLASAALAVVALLCLAGCKTPPPAPMYGAATVAPPATGMVGQPAPYGTPPQAVSYAPQAGSPMPGPATSWQGVPQASTTQPANTWNWSQAGSPTAQPVQAPSLQQYGNQMQTQANQLGNQMQNQTNQFANQTQQNLANQQQQLTNQFQNQANQYQQGFNNQVQQYGNQVQQGMQNAQQQLNTQMQQAMPQMPSAPQTQTVNGNWWPFSNPNALPPARATPTGITRY